jgi:asparagine synthase (glutamine-hydrolysing)
LIDSDTLVYVYGNVSPGDAEQHTYRSPQESGLRAFARYLVKAYERRGVQAFEELSGSFLLVVYQVAEQRLLVVTDRLCSRPVYYHRNEHETLFATDIRLILAYPDTPRDLDIRSIVEFLRFTMILGDRTLYEQIHCMPPASVMVLSPKGFSIDSYWTMAFRYADVGSERTLSLELAQALRRAVGRIVGDTDGVALMLSGGIDSRAIAAALASSDKKVLAISFGEFKNDEVKLAEKVASKLDWTHTLLQREPGYYTQILQDAVQISNGLYSFYHAHYFGLHDALHSNAISTTLEGWGLDLLFSGTYLPKRLIRLPGRKGFKVLSLAPFSPSTEDIVEHILASLGLTADRLVARLMSPDLGPMWRDWPRQVVSDTVRSLAARASNPYDRCDLFATERFWKFRSYLFPLSLRHGLKQRNPMFDNDVIDLFLSIPPELRFNGRVYRRALEHLNPDLCHIPYSRTGAPLTYPPPLENVFWVCLPFAHACRLRLRKWLSRFPKYPTARFDSYPDPDDLIVKTELRNQSVHWLFHGKYLELGILESNTVRKILDRHLTGQANYGWHLLALLSLAVWLEEWS